MSKFATKAAANMFCQARYEAAKSNERLSSREGAAEEIGIDRTRLARIELGSTIPYQEEVLLMADCYKAPELKGNYCREMCPLGKNMPKIENAGLDRISLRIWLMYELGAFYVADIEAESTIDITNRGLLSEESDPRLNLKKWLEEKTFKNPDKIVELAEPIIAEAMKQSTTAEIHGVFKPVSISVRNYRNYKEENFDFSDISFCTINGVNGAGKSSLFMDAIVDCLFEETREGDCKAWIRGTEDARSGSIEFIFDIGEKRFRVVRTRTKSGKPTLNLSQYQKESADWMNLSKERIIDTQAEIEKLLGMDSMTFRSCALIMQDHLEKCEEEIAALRIKRDEEISKKQDEICIIGYDAERLELLIRKARALVKYENLKKDAEKKKLEIARLETEKNTNSKTIGQYEEILLELNIKAQKATDIVAALSDSVIKHDDAVCKRNSVAHFADQEKELPVYEERKQHIDKRLTELYQERSKEDANELVLHNNLREAEIKLEELRKDIEGSEALEEVERRLKSTKETLEKAQIQKGVLTQRVEDVEAMRSEIALLNKGIAVAAEKADCYEALKQAFSQDGVPHQIIRNIIPHITDTTNNILGQMTGGTMGVEFVMERTVKGKDGDKATLDVLINEYGKTTLPYASKSGGEKVKASLKVLTYHFPPIISQTSHRLCECLFCCLCLYITICTVHVNSLLKKISKIMKKNIDKIENKRYNNIIKNREVLR